MNSNNNMTHFYKSQVLRSSHSWMSLEVIMCYISLFLNFKWGVCGERQGMLGTDLLLRCQWSDLGKAETRNSLQVSRMCGRRSHRAALPSTLAER